MLCLQPMQLYINLHILFYMSLCIYAMHATYAVIYKLAYTFLYSLCIYAMHATYAVIYKLAYIFLYEFMHQCYACILCSLI